MKRLLVTLMAMAIFILPVSAKPVLTVYTYESFTADWGPGPEIKKAFEKQCDCSLKWVAIADGVALLNRLRLEGNHTKADIVLGLDTNLVADAKATGLFAPSGIDQPKSAISDKWHDDIFLAYDYAPFAVIYNSEEMKNPPTSLDQLINGDTSQKIILQDPRTSTPGLGFLSWMKAVYGDKAAAKWEKLSKRVLTVTPGWSEAYGLFTKGEAPMVLSYVTSPAYHMIVEKTDKYRAAAFDEGHYLQIEVAGMIKGSKNIELARKFMNFMIMPGFQDQIPTKNWMFPAGKISGALPEQFDRLIKPNKLLLLDANIVASNRKGWIREWLGAASK